MWVPSTSLAPADPIVGDVLAIVTRAVTGLALLYANVVLIWVLVRKK